MIVITQEDRKLMERMAERIQILHEKKMPLVSTVLKIAKALNVNIIELTN